MQTQAMTIAASNSLDNLFEDIHWIILIAGHVLCMDCDGETPLIPSEIMQYSIEQNLKQHANLDATLKVFFCFLAFIDVRFSFVLTSDFIAGYGGRAASRRGYR